MKNDLFYFLFQSLVEIAQRPSNLSIITTSQSGHRGLNVHVKPGNNNAGPDRTDLNLKDTKQHQMIMCMT